MLFVLFCILTGIFIIWSVFREKKDNGTSLNIGVTTPNCPYCGVELAKFPGRKTKCKSCGNFIYVRTRPADNIKILIREDEKELIQIEWQKKNGTFEYFQKQRNELESIKEELKQKRNSEFISDNDVKWVYYQRKRLEAANIAAWHDYGVYSEQMAGLLFSEKKYRKALEHYLEAEYFNLCCAGNASDFSSKSFIKKMYAGGRFDVIRYLPECIEILKLNLKQVKEIFLEMLVVNAPFPLTKEEAWKYLKRALKEWDIV